MAATIVVRIRVQINVLVQTIPVLWLRVKVMQQGVVLILRLICQIGVVIIPLIMNNVLVLTVKTDRLVVIITVMDVVTVQQ